MEMDNELDNAAQEIWDDLAVSAIKAGVAKEYEDCYLITDAFLDHVDVMIKDELMDFRMALLDAFLRETDHVKLSDLDKTWFVVIGDFMINNGTFGELEQGIWLKATKFITAKIEYEMMKESGSLCP